MRSAVHSPLRDRSAPGLLRVAKGADALRAGLPVRLKDRGIVTMFAVETLSEERFRKLDRAWLVLTHARAQTLKIRLYTPEIVALKLSGEESAEQLRAVADPTHDLDTPLKGPFQAVRRKLPRSFAVAAKLAKLAGLLPAAVLVRRTFHGVTVPVKDVFAYESETAAKLAVVTRARVPLEGAEEAELVAFRAFDGAPENFAVVIGRPPTSEPVLTRLHSECFTGDLLGSLKCDCGPQLRGAIKAIAEAGGGILLYMAQEGRGIGLINKLRAYRLQDQGFDTIEANERLGFAADERLYDAAARMLTLLGYRTVRLLTNNPEKVAGLKAAGIEVCERVPLVIPGNEHNRAYLKTKAEKAGHLF